MSLGEKVPIFLFRFFLNPVDYNGQLYQELVDTYKTNELGFLIGVMFAASVCQTFLSYRRYSLLEQRKRFIFQ